MKKRLIKGAAFLLVLITLTGVAMPVLADEEVVATVALNLRQGPGTNYPIVGELKKGASATRTGTSGNWSILKIGSNKVYASSAYLKLKTQTTQESVMYTTAKLNVRTGPGTGYKAISYVDKGAPVYVIGQVGSWSIIKWNDGTAYVSSAYLKGGSTTTPAPTTTPSGQGSLQTATTPVNVRIGPGSSYAILGVLMPGETVTRTGTTGVWAKVIYKGQVAYIHQAYLKDAKDDGFTSASGNMKATQKTTVRSGPGNGYSSLGTLMENEIVKLTGYAGSWAQINYKGKTGYVPSSVLKSTGSYEFTPASGRYELIGPTIGREGPSSSYPEIISFMGGEAVERVGTSGSYTLVTYGSKACFVLTSRIRKV